MTVDELLKLRKEAEDYIGSTTDEKIINYNKRVIFVIDELVSAISAEHKMPFRLYPDDIKGFEYSDIPISTSELCRSLNDLRLESMWSIRPSAITKGLYNMGYMTIDNASNRRIPNEKGERLGIIVEHKTSVRGTIYPVCRLNKSAQQFVVENINEILEQSRGKLPQ